MPRLQLIEDLAADPWFQLSTAGQERFHTNMLYWLAKYRWSGSRAVWDLLAPDLAREADPPVATREKRHIDLTLEGRNSCLFLENKVLDLPRRQQLDEYREEHADTPGAAFVLLSMIDPAFDLEPWRRVSFGDLAARLGDVRLPDPDEARLLSDYRRLIGRLLNLASAYDSETFLKEAFLLQRDEERRASEGRVLTLIHKLRMSRFSVMVAKGLPDNCGEVTAGLTRSRGLSEFFCNFNETVQIGWQIQHDQFRLAARRTPRTTGGKEEFRAIESGHHPVCAYFRSIDTPPPNFARAANRKDWCRFASTFLYKYWLIPPDTNVRMVAAAAVEAAQQAKRFCSENRP